MRSRSFACSFFLSVLVMNFLLCVNFFGFSMASPCGHCIATQPLHYALSFRRRAAIHSYSRCDLLNVVGQRWVAPSNSSRLQMISLAPPTQPDKNGKLGRGALR